MKVRVAMLGISHGAAAETQDDVTVGVKMPWIEIDGIRHTDVVSAQFEAAQDSVSECVLHLSVLGPIELVYVGADGEPLRGAALQLDPTMAERLGKIDYETSVAKQELTQ